MEELDTDHSGKIDSSELLTLMADSGIDVETIKEFIADHDKDGDGQLDEQELIEFLQSVCG